MASKTIGQMAKVAPAVAPKAALPTKVVKALADDKQSTSKSGKMHKRSRSGCFTCRLRRKKCNEEKPACRACRHLGLKCEYKRPLWWSNAEQRKAEKENIKEVIKRTKINEKAAQQGPSTDAAKFQRAGSQDSYDSFDFNQTVHDQVDIYHPQVYTPQFEAQFDPAQSYTGYTTPGPYEVDVKTERQIFVNDVPTRTDTTISSFSTYHLPDAHDTHLHNIPEENWLHEEIYDDPANVFATGEDESDFGIFDFSHASAPPTRQASISVDEADRPLLDHFIDHVLPLTFPILDSSQPGLARSEVILPALESNKTYLHCCLSAAAVHMKFTMGLSAPPSLDNDIIRHRFATITELCESFKRNTDHSQILDATLALIFFQSATGHPDDTSPDIPWHQHFVGAVDLIRRLGYDQVISHGKPGEDPMAAVHPPFSMSLAAWIDVLGSTMMGRAPLFADSYRDAHLAGRPLGLASLMGCEDNMMVIISEIACLEALKIDRTLSDDELCSHITLLAQQMDFGEVPPNNLVYPHNAETGALRPRQLSTNVTALFRKAARIWLQSLVPGASRQTLTMQNSLSQFAELMDMVPDGPQGFDRSLVWPVFIAGIQTSRGGTLRSKIESRWNAMGDSRDLGTFGRMVRLLREVWRRNDEVDMRNSANKAAAGSSISTETPMIPDVHWRDVMRECRLDFLPI